MTKPTLMDRTRAAVALVNGRDDEDVKLAAFMELFHPRKEGPRSRAELKELRR